jgi:hypothetical protein
MTSVCGLGVRDVSHVAGHILVLCRNILVVANEAVRWMTRSWVVLVHPNGEVGVALLAATKGER